MSLKTVKVELNNGRVSPLGKDTLPDHAEALLIFSEENLDASSSYLINGDAMRKYAGIGKGIYQDLSCNKAHLDDLGK